MSLLHKVLLQLIRHMTSAYQFTISLISSYKFVKQTLVFTSSLGYKMMLHFIIAAAILFGRVYPLTEVDTCSNPCKNPCVNDDVQPACTKCCQCLEKGPLRCQQKQHGSVTLVYKQNGVVVNDDVDSDGLFNFIGSGYDNTSSTRLVYGHCRYCQQLGLDFEETESKPTVIVAQNSTLHDLCKENATGFLCSRCDSDTYHNRKGDCVSCSNPGLHWFIFIIIEIVPITILFFILYITGFNLISGALNSAIFFAQMITTTMDITGDGFIPISNITNNSQTSENLVNAYRFLYEFWNLEFFAPFSRNLCLFPYVESPLVYFVVEYIIAFYPILLLAFVVFVRAICRRVKDRYRKDNDDNGSTFWDTSMHNLSMSVFVLSYSKLAITSAMLVVPVRIYNVSNHYVYMVMLYDPSIRYLSKYFAFIVIGYIILLVQFFFPIVLILLYMRRRHILRLNKFYKLFLNKDCEFDVDRVVEAIFLLLRVSLLIVYVIPFVFAHQFVIEQAILLIGAIAISFFPNRKRMNRFDMFMLLLLVFVNTLSIYQYSLVEGSRDLSLSVFVTQYILVYVPAVWILAYIVARFALWWKEKCHNNEHAALLGDLSVHQ